MLNSLRDGQINYGTTNCPSAHVPPHNVVTPLHQNSPMSTETTTPVVYPWNSNPRLEHLYGFHSRYYNLDFPTPYSSTANQYVPTNMYGQNVPQCCQPCCRLRSQNIPKTSPPVLYNPIRPVQQVNRSYKSKKTLKTPCSEQFLPYIPHDAPVQYDTQNSYQQKYSSSYLNSTNYCPPSNNNLWIPPATNSTWPSDRLRPLSHHTSMITSDFNRDKNYPKLPNYQNNTYSSSTAGATHHRPYNYNPPTPDIHDYRPSIYHNQLKTSTSEYLPQEHSSRLPTSSQNNQSQPSVQQYYNTQPIPYSDVQRPSETLKTTQVTSQSSSKSNLNVREFLANWDEGEEETSEKSSETTTPIVVLDCMTLEGEALTKIQEKLNVVSYEHLEKVLKENHNPLVMNTASNEIDSIHNKTKPPVKSNFEPLDYTKRETGIIKPFITEKKVLPEINSRPDKSYSVNFDGMVTWYGKKNTDISSTDLIEKLADRIFNLSKSQENEGVSFGTAAYTGQITQTNRSIESLIKDPAKYVQSPHMFNLQNHTEKGTEPSVINKIDRKNDAISRAHCCVLNENDKASTMKSNNINSSCIVENISKKCLNLSNTNEETTPWNLNQVSQEQHLNMSLYDHSVITKPLDFSSLTDENKGNPFVFEKNLSSSDKLNGSINNQFNKVLNENNNYNSIVSSNQHSIQQIDSSNRNFPVIVSPHIQRQEYNVFHESVIQRTGCDKNKHEKVSTQADLDNINWNLSNDLDKIMKNTNIASIEPPCLYDRNNFSILDSMNSNKIVSTQWKDNVPCVDLTVNGKTNPNHDSFFDGWNFIDTYEHHSSKKVINPSSNNSEVHNPLFFNQITSLEELNNRSNNINKKVENETMVTLKDVSYLKPTDLSSSNSMRSRDVFNLNNRIPDFSDGFELTAPNELHEYMQFKKSSNGSEHRTDGSIFEHLTEPKCVKNVKEMTNAKNEQIKPDIVGLPTFKEKDPLAPMSVPSKLNIVKPIIRDPNQIFTVIKQKLKHDNADNDSVVSNKAGLYLRGNQTNTFNGTDMKPKYNNGQLSQFDVWSEKFVLKGNSNNTASSVVQCDVEITQFKSTSDNCNTLTSKSNINESYQDKNMILPENVCANKLNINENDKLNSNDFLNCLDCSKTDNQKYRDPLDEFETSFGFDMHCNNETNKSFHENIVDNCLEERINDQIGKDNMNTSGSTNTTTSNINNTQLPFQCDFQSSYLIKNYFDENKDKPIILDQERTSNNEKLSATALNFHSGTDHSFELQNNKNIHTTQNPEKKSEFNMINDINRNFEEQIKNNMKDEHSNCSIQTNLKLPFESNRDINTGKTICKEKNNFNYLTLEDNSYEFKNNKSIEIHKHNETTDACKINYSSNSNNSQNLSNIQKHPTSIIAGFELNDNSTNIFETNESTITKDTTSNDKNRELETTKNTFKSTFCPENLENIDHQIRNKNIFELKNNNNDSYQTHNLEKIPEFDFETRIIQNFEIKCSNNNIQEPVSKTEIFTNKNQISSDYSFKINDGNYKGQKEFKNSFDILEKPLIEETLESDCNTQPRHVNETNNVNQKNNHIFEVDCMTNTNKNSDNDSNFDVRNVNAEKINLDNGNTHANCNVEVENIFEDLYDNLNILNSEKDNPGDSYSQNDAKDDLSKSLENLKTTNLETIVKNCEETQVVKFHSESDKTFEDNDHVLLDNFVNISNSHSTKVSLQQNEPLVGKTYDKTIDENLMSDKYNTNLLKEHLPNNENFLNYPNKITVCENINKIEEEPSKINTIRQNNMPPLKNMAVNTVKSSAVKEIFEGMNVFDDELITQSSLAKKQENTSINPVELSIQENLNKMIDTEDSTCSLINTVNQQYSNEIVDLKNVPNNQYSRKLVDVENIISSKNNSTDFVKLTSHQDSNGVIDSETNTNPSHSSINLDKLTRHEESNQNIDVDDKANFEHSPLNHVKSKQQQNSHTTGTVKNTTHSVSSSLNTNELVYENSNEEIISAEDTNTVSGSLNHISIKSQQHFNTIDEVEDETNLTSSLLNGNELSREHDSNEVIDVEDTTDIEPSLFRSSGQLQRQSTSKMVEVENVSHSGPSSFNVSEFTGHQDSNEITDIKNNFESNLFHNSELLNQQHSNKTVIIEDTSNFRPSTVNNLELLNNPPSNNVVNSEDTTHFKPRSSNNLESSNKLHSNKIAKVDDTTSSNPLNVDKFTNQKFNTIIGVDEISNFKPTSLNKVEFTNHQHSTQIVEIVKSTKPLPNSLNIDKITGHQNCNEILATEDKTHYKSNTLYNSEVFDHQNSNEIAEVECTTDSNSRPLNVDDLACDNKYNDNVDDVTNFRSRLLNMNESCKDQSSNEIVKVQGTTISGFSPLNVDKSILHQTYNEIKDVDDKTHFGSSSLNNEKLTQYDISNKTIDFENATGLELSSFKIVEFSCEKHSNTIMTEDTTNCSIINVEQKHQHLKEIFNESTSLKKSTLIENNSSKKENNFSDENTNSKSAEDIKLPRVKFFLKCSKNVIKNNVFDKEPLSCKKPGVVKDIKLVAGNMFKKRKNFLKMWQNIPKQISVNESKDSINKVVETDNTPINSTIVSNADNLQQNNDKVSFAAEFTYSDQEKQNQYGKILKNNEILNNDSLHSSTADERVDNFCLSPAGKDNLTPVPSPFADFRSDSPTSEYCGSDEYWDKSLENKYNSVLYKTISKLISKRRVNIRDKFNTRLLARRASKTKHKQRIRRRRRFNETELLVGDNELKTGNLTTVVEMPTALLRLNVTTEKMNPKCKIKVQLPWGRIFNLKNPRPKDQLEREVYKETKLELGPAKVKVRLSRSPGEWQVATCCQSNQPKSTVVSVRRLVLQREMSPTALTNDYHDQSCSTTSTKSCYVVGNNPQQEERTRKLPKIVIRRNEQDNNYTSYVSTYSGIEFEGGDGNKSDDDEDTPRLIVRLIRDRKLDAMAADGITKLNLTHLVPKPETVAVAVLAAEEEEDTHSAKRLRYT